MNDAVVRALEAGASGFLVKTSSPEEICRAVRAAAGGDSVLCPSSARQLIDMVTVDPSRRGRRQDKANVEQLTPREFEVATRVPLGETNDQIAAAVHLSPASVKQYLSVISEKLGIQGRVKLAVLLTQAGYGPK